jgi:hypothetical protein
MSLIAIDFDGTCVTHAFPKIGSDIGAVPVLKDLVAFGHHLILWTMRSDFNNLTVLSEAVDWFKQQGIPLFAINKNPTQHKWTSSPKAYCELYIDDAALNIPLVHPKDERPYVDWVKTRLLLVQIGYLK